FRSTLFDQRLIALKTAEQLCGQPAPRPQMTTSAQLNELTMQYMHGVSNRNRQVGIYQSALSLHGRRPCSDIFEDLRQILRTTSWCGNPHLAGVQFSQARQQYSF